MARRMREVPAQKKGKDRTERSHMCQCSDAALPFDQLLISFDYINPFINSLITYPRSCPTLATVGRWGQRHASMRTRRSHREYPPRPVPMNLERRKGRERERRERRERQREGLIYDVVGEHSIITILTLIQVHANTTNFTIHHTHTFSSFSPAHATAPFPVRIAVRFGPPRAPRRALVRRLLLTLYQQVPMNMIETMRKEKCVHTRPSG